MVYGIKKEPHPERARSAQSKDARRPSKGAHLMRNLVAALLSLPTVLAFSDPAAAEAVVKVGIILTYSGPYASDGEEIDRAAELYLKLHQKDLPPGVRIELLKRDDTGPSPDVAKRLAQDLIVRDRVQILAGCVFTPNAAAIAPLATEAKVPFVLMGTGTSSTTRLSPYITRFSFTQWQMSEPLGRWAAANGYRTVATLVTDYAPGYDAEAAFTRGFTEGGSKVVSALRVPVKNPDFAPFLARIRDAAPSALFVFTPGGGPAVAVVKAFKELGLDKAGIQLMTSGATLADNELPSLGEAALGAISASHYSASGERPANAAFVAAWREAYGADSLPNYFSVGGWDAMAAIVDVVSRQKGTIDPARSMEILKGWANPESPRGPILIDAETRDIVQNIYIRKVERVKGALTNVEFATVAAVKDPWKQLNPP
jgi:branched-chain amino acid transport system substrate-binding protein